MIGLVPQELTTDAFEIRLGDGVLQPRAVRQADNPAHIEKVLKDLSLWDKKDSKIMTLSGGMKRRVLIAKALSHEPHILFLDEPTAGVDVELRKDMWQMVRALRDCGVTIILTTHYIEEAEEMADRVGVINKGEIILVEEKAELMRKLGKKQLTLQLHKRLDAIPASSPPTTRAVADGSELIYTYDTQASVPASPRCSRTSTGPASASRTSNTTQSSLEDIFVDLVRREMNSGGPRDLHVSKWRAPGARCCRASSSPVISTSLYFVVFGAAIGSRITEIEGVHYGAFIVPG